MIEEPIERRDDMLIRPWIDRVTERHGFPMADRYVEWYWLPVIGPTALCAARRLVEQLGDQDHMVIEVSSFAALMGLSYKRGYAHSPFGRGLERLVTFGLAMRAGDEYLIRTHAPPVPHRHQRRWPVELQRLHSIDLELHAAS